jgi:predicted nucleic acid-binding protein
VCRRIYLDASVVIDIMKLKNGIGLKREKKELAIRNKDNIKSLGKSYTLTIPTVAVGEVIKFIREIEDGRKRSECLSWLWDFLEEHDVDVLPIMRDVVFSYDSNCVFTIAKEIISRESSNPDDWWGGKTLDGNDALILAQAVLDENNVSVVLTTDSRMLTTTTVYDVIDMLKETGRLNDKKLKIIDDLSDL